MKTKEVVASVKPKKCIQCSDGFVRPPDAFCNSCQKYDQAYARELELHNNPPAKYATMSIWGKLFSTIITLFVTWFLLALILVAIVLILGGEYFLTAGPLLGIYFLATHSYESIRTKFCSS